MRRHLAVIIAVIAFALIATMCNSADAAFACPGDSQPVPFGPADTELVHITQPNAPAGYVRVIAPNGTHWDFNDRPLFGQFELPGVVGQWWVCYTTDLDGTLAELGWTAPTVDDGTCTDDNGEPGLYNGAGECITEAEYDKRFGYDNLATIPSYADPTRSIAEVHGITPHDDPASHRPRFFAGIELPSFARLIADRHIAL